MKFKKSLILSCIALSLSGTSDAADRYYPDFKKLSESLYEQQPNIYKCYAGVLNDTQKQNVISTLNVIRQLHGLSTVSYEHNEQDDVMSTSLLMAANGQISHAPPKNWDCWSEASFKTSRDSLLSGGVTANNITFYTPGQDIINWLMDTKAMSVGGIGHRRWILDPFLERVAYGRVSGEVNGGKQSVASTLKIMRPRTNTGHHHEVIGPVVISYPQGDYPKQFYDDDAPLSLSIMIDSKNKTNNEKVDFSKATINIKLDSGKSVRVYDIATDNNFYGLPNNLQFSAGELKVGERYNVTVENVLIHGESKTYQYWFRIN